MKRVIEKGPNCITCHQRVEVDKYYIAPGFRFVCSNCVQKNPVIYRHLLMNQQLRLWDVRKEDRWRLI